MNSIIFSCLAECRMFYAEAHKPDDLPAIAEQLISSFPEERVFLFHAEMGAGKTTFIKAICSCLGVKDTMSSPTYSLVNEYKGDKFTMYHFDLYRVKHVEECFDFGFEEYVNSGHYCFIEWPEIAEPIMPQKHVDVFIEVKSNSRNISAKTSNGI